MRMAGLATRASRSTRNGRAGRASKEAKYRGKEREERRACGVDDLQPKFIFVFLYTRSNPPCVKRRGRSTLRFGRSAAAKQTSESERPCSLPDGFAQCETGKGWRYHWYFSGRSLPSLHQSWLPPLPTLPPPTTGQRSAPLRGTPQRWRPLASTSRAAAGHAQCRCRRRWPP